MLIVLELQQLRRNDQNTPCQDRVQKTHSEFKGYKPSFCISVQSLRH